MSIIGDEKLFERTIEKRQWPVNINNSDLNIFKPALEITFPEIHLINYQDAGITPQGIIFEGYKRYEQSFIWPYFKEEYNWFYLFKNYIRRKRIRLDHSTLYISCFDGWTNGYYHWICDFLPRLYSIQHILKDKKTKLILPDFIKSEYMNTCLRLFDISEDRIVRFSKNSYVSVPNLLVPDRPTLSGDHNSFLMTKVKEIIMDGAGIKHMNNVSDKVYVSRAKANYRKIVNENDLIELMKKYNYEVVYFEDHNFLEQVKLMSGAKVIAGLHGGNLTNSLFMNTGGTMMEIRLENSDNNCFFSLANANGLKYFYNSCEVLPTNHFPDARVNVSSIEDTLKMIEHHL